MEQLTDQNQKKPKNFWQRLICLVLSALLLFFIIVSPLIWIMRDGLGPNVHDSNGLEAMHRFFMTFYFGPLFLFIFCLRLFVGRDRCCCKNQYSEEKPFSLMIAKTLLVILTVAALGTIIACGLIVNYYKVSHNQLVLLEKQVVLTTNKTEYQTGEEVKLTVGNNLDEENIFGTLEIEIYKNNNWVLLVKNIYHKCSFVDKVSLAPLSVNADQIQEYKWDQKIGLCDNLLLGTKLRFRTKLLNNPGDRRERIYYSNEFTIKDSVIGPPPGNIVCSQDSDCEINYADYCCGKWEGCFNKYDNPGNIGDLNDPNCKCVKREPIEECRCVNNVCQPIYENNKETENSDKIIQNLIQQMGDDNISQEIKNAIPEKLYDYGKEAIPYLIGALDDERVFDPCYIGPSGFDGQLCYKHLVKHECRWIIDEIITPSPLLGYKYSYSYKAEGWQQWWNENQNKSLNEIRKMVRDYYRSEEEKNNYLATGYRGVEYDYLDFVGNLTDWDWDSGQDCHGLTNFKQCSYLNWPISYGYRVAQIGTCYECLAEKNRDATICENIEDEDWKRKDNCYLRCWAIFLREVEMRDKIDFCDKFSTGHCPAL